MIVCHCHGLTDRDIRTVAERTAARSTQDLGLDCPAGRCCGGCEVAVEQILASCARHRADGAREPGSRARRSA